jgi:hypothetical protein
VQATRTARASMTKTMTLQGLRAPSATQRDHHGQGTRARDVGSRPGSRLRQRTGVGRATSRMLRRLRGVTGHRRSVKPPNRSGGRVFGRSALTFVGPHAHSAHTPPPSLSPLRANSVASPKLPASRRVPGAREGRRHPPHRRDTRRRQSTSPPRPTPAVSLRCPRRLGTLVLPGGSPGGSRDGVGSTIDRKGVSTAVR